MKLQIDTDKKILIVEADGESRVIDLYSKKAFELISDQWLAVGWRLQYSYSFTWLGRPVIQLPEDMVRIQEVIYRVMSDVIVETGIAHGGSLVFYASLCEAMDRGRVIGVDKDIRRHNRDALEAHELFRRITLIEGDSISPETIGRVKNMIDPGETVLVILDSCHSKKHVLAELESYHDIVTSGSYIVATDGIIKELDRVPGGEKEWEWDNPKNAAIEFASMHPEFVIEQPPRLFDESRLSKNVTYWPSAFLKRK